jgi:uncharacterized protein YndB with AHSA1/START domain
MSKKQSKSKKVKKAVKPIKIKPASKKAKPVKSAKNKINKKVAKVVKKTTAKKMTKNIVKKKAIVKKVAKPIKKVTAKKIPAKKIVKVVKKLASKKAVAAKPKKVDKKIKKTVQKPISSKPLKKAILKTVKEEKKAKVILSIAPKVASKNDDKFNSSEKVKVKPSRKKGGRKPKGSGDDDEPEIIHDELVEQLIRSTKKLRQPKKPKFIRTFTNPRASLAVVLKDTTNKKGSSVQKKEPKGKYELEYVAHTSPGILFEFLTTPSGLSEWFADDVNIQDGIFTFFWDGSEQKAKLLSFKEDKFVRFQWFDKPDGTYFEFRIEKDELTGDIALIIVDFADEATDMKTSKLLWDSQITKLLHVIGSY